MRADGSQTRKLMDLSPLRSDRARNNDVPFYVEDFAWSPDGKRILFSSHETPPGSRNRSLPPFTNYRIYVMNADGSEKIWLTEDSGFREVDSALWSPDGERVAFGCDDDICVVDADGGKILRLTDNDATDREESRSPDVLEFYKERLLREEQGEQEKVASADGREKAYVCKQENVGWRRDDKVEEHFRICVEDQNGGVTELQGAPGGGSGLAWSPDGQNLAFVAVHTVADEFFTGKPGSHFCDIYVAGRDFSVRTRRVIEDVGEDTGCGVSWTPDGRWLLYKDNGGLLGRSGTYAIRADGSTGPKFVAAEPRSPEEDLRPPTGYDYLGDLKARPRGN